MKNITMIRDLAVRPVWKQEHYYRKAGLSFTKTDIAHIGNAGKLLASFRKIINEQR